MSSKELRVEAQRRMKEADNWKVIQLWKKYLEILKAGGLGLPCKQSLFEIVEDMAQEYTDGKGQEW